MQKYIVCQNCRYFPNKIDQVKGQQVKRQPYRIHWQCKVCFKSNLYSNDQAVVLPETQLVQINQDNLLKNYIKNVNIIIDFNNIKTSICPFYIPLFKQQINKVCGIEQQNLKDISCLQNQSQWFARYRSIFLGFTKFILQQCNLFSQKSHTSYLIYLIHRYIQTIAMKQHQNQIKTTIFILHKCEVYSFYIDTQSSITTFLKIYCLLQIEDKIPWLLNFYTQQLIECRRNKMIDSQIDNILLIGDYFEMEEQNIRHYLEKIELNIKIAQLIINKDLIILKSDNLQSNLNVFAINPYSKQSFINYIQTNSQKKKQLHNFIQYCFHNIPNKQQLAIIYFKSKNQILAHVLKQSQIQSVRSRLLSKPIPQEKTLKEICKISIKNNFSIKQMKLIKLYCEFYIEDQKRIVLYTFNWYKIERDLLFEELFDQSQILVQLKEDSLNEKPIKINKISPFIKKNTVFVEFKENQLTNEEDYQYL